MITTFLHIAAGRWPAILAANLAVLRSRTGASVQILDTQPQHPAAVWCVRRTITKLACQVRVKAGYDGAFTRTVERHLMDASDVLINAGRRDVSPSLNAAHAAIVIVDVDVKNARAAGALPPLITQARRSNPGLRVLICGVSRQIAVHDNTVVHQLATRIHGAQAIGTLTASQVLADNFATGATPSEELPESHASNLIAGRLYHALYRD